MSNADAARVLAESLSQAINVAAALRSGIAPTAELLQDLSAAVDTAVRTYSAAQSPNSQSQVHAGQLDLRELVRILGALCAAFANQGSHLVYDDHIADLCRQLVDSFSHVGTG